MLYSLKETALHSQDENMDQLFDGPAVNFGRKAIIEF